MIKQHLPFVSVCIPVYNGSNYIKDCINSVIDQNYSNFELLIVDNYSEDETRSIIKGTLNYEEALAITIQRTCQFAKRQKTWFRNKHNSKWLDDENSLPEALSYIYEILG